MGKRYYCDYCDKSFADNPVSRKTHLTGVAHLQNKKAHYDSFRDEKQILDDDRNKKPCRAFLTHGECKFGDRCQYSHLTNEVKAQLAQIVRQKQEQAEARLHEASEAKSNTKSSLQEWVEKRNKRRKLESPDKETVGENMGDSHYHVPDYKLADSLSMFPILPPSLLPPSKEAVLNSDYAEWG